jgi:hypothetical protein
VNGDQWLDDYYARWLYDMELVDRANEELQLAAQPQETDE